MSNAVTVDDVDRLENVGDRTAVAPGIHPHRTAYAAGHRVDEFKSGQSVLRSDAVTHRIVGYTSDNLLAAGVVHTAVRTEIVPDEIIGYTAIDGGHAIVIVGDAVAVPPERAAGVQVFRYLLLVVPVLVVGGRLCAPVGIPVETFHIARGPDDHIIVLQEDVVAVPVLVRVVIPIVVGMTVVEEGT